MRVIAGKYKGFNLLSPKSKDSRPTDNKVKEAIFDMLYPLKENFISLDLFSGTGQMGIEFLSRGAKSVYFNERNPKTFRILKENLKKIKSEDHHTLRLDFRKALAFYKKNGLVFDYIFLDPPYDGNYLQEAINLILDYELLAHKSIMITESDRNIDFSNYKGLRTIKEKSYGRKIIKFYIRDEDNLSR
ncbi:MAG: 16S rRNA (guanine(966)-N(2))-methyltransferase RsmD [Anaerococcus sp.]|nr:16S rRNA (guanine(966)-N(2))-methyltransferase RsmD [Anaerococcus sp.]